jgi:hypothetical protein
VHALRSIHAALVPEGMVVDTQPISPEPPVGATDRRLGTLDMRDWRETIDAVDARTALAIDAGLFAVVAEHTIEVVDEFDSGAEFVEVVGAWRGTRIPPAVIDRATTAQPPVRVAQEVRLRLLRALT